VYTVFCDTNADNADIGEPIFTKPEESTAESTEIETTEAEVTNQPTPESTSEQTEPSDNGDKKEPSLLLPIAIGSTVAIAAIGAVVFICSKRKRK
jgi:hypothetical protein